MNYWILYYNDEFEFFLILTNYKIIILIHLDNNDLDNSPDPVEYLKLQTSKVSGMSCK